MSAVVSPGASATIRTAAQGARPWLAILPCTKGSIIEKLHSSLQSDPSSQPPFAVPGALAVGDDVLFARPSWSPWALSGWSSWPSPAATTTPWSPEVAA